MFDTNADAAGRLILKDLLFMSRAHMPACVQAGLEGLLPQLRKTLKLPRLEFTSIVNQGDWLVEVPADMASIPRVCTARRSLLLCLL